MSGESRFRGKPDLPEQKAFPQPEATLHYERPNGDRGTLTYTARSPHELDHRIIQAISELRSRACRMVKTELLTADGEEWIYEYDTTGHVERTFRFGDVTP